MKTYQIFLFVFLFSKLTHNIDWSWWLVLSPIWWNMTWCVFGNLPPVKKYAEKFLVDEKLKLMMKEYDEARKAHAIKCM